MSNKKLDGPGWRLHLTWTGGSGKNLRFDSINLVVISCNHVFSCNSHKHGLRLQIVSFKNFGSDGIQF